MIGREIGDKGMQKGDYLMGLKPIVSHADLDRERHRELAGVLHLLLQDVGHDGQLVIGDFENKLVMHLENHAGAEIAG